jgi:hypothetical protein
MRSSLFWYVTQCRLVVTDFSRHPVGTVLEGRSVCLDSLTLVDGTYKLCRNVGGYHSALRYIADERRFYSELIFYSCFGPGSCVSKRDTKSLESKR